MLKKEIINSLKKEPPTIRIASGFSIEILQANRGFKILRGSCLHSPKLSIKHEGRIKTSHACLESKSFPGILSKKATEGRNEIKVTGS